MQLSRALRSTLRRYYLYLLTIFLSVAVLFCVFHIHLRYDKQLLPLFARSRTERGYDMTPVELREEALYMNIAENDLKQRLPNALIIGIRKGGTRALIDSLSRHPDVRACPQEIHFFDRRENYELGLNWYKSQMPLSFNDQITIEKTPAYFVTDDVPRLVHKMSASVKLLVVVRDPTVRAISDYAQLFDKHHGTLKPFEEYITEDLQHRALRTTSAIVNTGVYINHLKKWLEYFPIEQIHFVNGEELAKHPVNEMKSVEKFLGLEPFIDETLYYFNETKGFPCLVPASSKNGEKTVSGCLSETKGRSHPPVNEDVVTLLRDFYRPFNEEFYYAVGRNFRWP